ncbi:hypothetical protein BHM03_00053667 [Ensete ventricosum]|nr:hypothetical protein BHM03_00053667 [Ensete ventricosum]
MRAQETHLSPYGATVEEGTEREGKAGEVEIEPPGATAVFAGRSDHQAGRTLSSAPTWFPIQEQILREATKKGVPALTPEGERILRQGSFGMQRSSCRHRLLFLRLSRLVRCLSVGIRLRGRCYLG